MLWMNCSGVLSDTGRLLPRAVAGAVRAYRVRAQAEAGALAWTIGAAGAEAKPGP